MFNTYIVDFSFILFSIIFFFTFIFIPLFALLLNIFYYGTNISYIKINFYLFYYNLPLVIIYFILYSLFDIKYNLVSLLLSDAISIVYYSPLIFLINKYLLCSKGIRSFAKCFIIFNILFFILNYMIYYIIKF